MPRDSNGNTQPIGGSIVTRGDTILPSQHNPPLIDLYAMMGQSLSRDGQGGMRAILNMNGFRVTNAQNGTLPTDLATVGQVSAMLPVGAVIDYAGTNAPTGWLLCFGQSLPRATYPDLFAAIGTAYGGVGQNFNLPDCRGRVVAARDDMGGVDAGRLTFFGVAAKLLGGVFGAASHILTMAQMAKHSHGGDTGPNGQHTHNTILQNRRGADGNAGANSGWDAGDVGLASNISKPTTEAPNHTHTILEQGNDEAHTNAQPTIIMNKIIKVV